MEVKQFDAISAPTCERLSSLVFPSFFKPTSQNAFDRFRFLHDNIQIFISDAAQLLAKMKRRPLLIITARGGLVSELPWLKCTGGVDRGQDFDVLSGEPPRDGSGRSGTWWSDQI